MASAVMTWFRANLPTREAIAANKWMRPIARHILRPELWRFHRRSVPRGVALGLFIAPVVPVAHTLVAAALAVPTRANVVVAASVTWLINPITMPPFYIAAYYTGFQILHLGALPVSGQIVPVATHASFHLSRWLAETSGPLALGTLVLASVIALAGYVFAAFGWSFWIARKWRSRARNRN